MKDILKCIFKFLAFEIFIVAISRPVETHFRALGYKISQALVRLKIF